MATNHIANPIVFRLTPAALDLVVATWGDVDIVYQRRSGETHAFNEVTTHLLECLSEGPATLSDLLCRVALHFDVEPEELTQDAFLRVTSRLEELGLIEATSCR